MTQKAYPLNDTEYLAEDVQLFHAARYPGIFNVTGSDLKVSSAGGMNLNISTGIAFLLTSANGIGGITYYSNAVERLVVSTASTSDRYDYISVRYSKSENKALLKYVRGGGSKPTPVRSSVEYEIILAIIKVKANVASITNADIEDTRLNSKYCGIVIDGTERIPTDGFNQEFRTFMDSIKSVLDSNTAGNLLNKINENKSQINTLSSRPTIYKGTSANPPSGWKDGDIYVMYE